MAWSSCAPRRPLRSTPGGWTGGTSEPCVCPPHREGVLSGHSGCLSVSWSQRLHRSLSPAPCAPQLPNSRLRGVNPGRRALPGGWPGPDPLRQSSLKSSRPGTRCHGDGLGAPAFPGDAKVGLEPGRGGQSTPLRGREKGTRGRGHLCAGSAGRVPPVRVRATEATARHDESPRGFGHPRAWAASALGPAVYTPRRRCHGNRCAPGKRVLADSPAPPSWPGGGAQRGC